MPRSRAQLEQAAAQAEAWLDQLDPADPDLSVEDPRELRDIAHALAAVAAAEQDLAAAVTAARTAGRSWSDVARVLGISRQAAQKRFDSPTAVVPRQR